VLCYVHDDYTVGRRAAGGCGDCWYADNTIAQGRGVPLFSRTRAKTAQRTLSS